MNVRPTTPLPPPSRQRATRPPVLRRRGVTLMELLIGVALTGIVLTMGLETLRLCRAVGLRGQAIGALTLAAQDALARATLEPFDTLTSGTFLLQLDMPTSVDSVAPEARMARIERDVVAVGRNLKEVRIHAVWTMAAEPTEIELITRIARPAAARPPPETTATDPEERP